MVGLERHAKAVNTKGDHASVVKPLGAKRRVARALVEVAKPSGCECLGRARRAGGVKNRPTLHNVYYRLYGEVCKHLILPG